MPIVYETPAPISFAAGSGSGTSNRGGGGGGVSLAEMYAAEMQQKGQAAAIQAQLMQRDRQFQDQFREGQQEFAAQRAFSPRDQGFAEVAAAQQQQRVMQQAQLNQSELSQSENLRLQRLKQGEDGVYRQLGENAITRDEAKQMLTQIRTGINPLEMRKAASQVQHQDMQNQALQSHMKLEMQRAEAIGKQEEARLQFSNAQAEGKIKRIPNQMAADQLRREWAPDFEGRPPQELAAAIEEELMAKGEYKTYMIAKDGTLVEAKLQDQAPGAEGEHGSGSGSGTSSRSRSGGGRGNGAKEFDPTHAYDAAERAVDKLVSDGVVKPEDAEAEIQRRYEARKTAHSGFGAEREQAATAGKAQPFSVKDMASGSTQQRAKVEQLETARRSLPQNVPPAEQARFSKAVDEAMRLVSRYSTAEGKMDHAPAFVKKRMQEINAVLNDVKSKKYPEQRGDGSADYMNPQQRALLEKLAAQAQEAEAQGRYVEPPAPGAPAPAKSDYRKLMEGNLVTRENAAERLKGGLHSLWKGDLVTKDRLKRFFGDY